MKSLPKKAQIYIVIIFLSALGLMLYYTVRLEFNSQLIVGLTYFAVLAVITDSLRVNLQKGGYVTVTFAVTYVCILLFGAVVASYVTIVGIILSKFIIRDKSPWYKIMFNCGQLVICVFAGWFIYTYMGGEIGRVNILNFLPLVASIGICFVINDLALCIILWLVQGVSPWRIWITNLKWTLPNFFALSLLSILMANIYIYAGYWGVSLFFGPLLLARNIFKSYMEVRSNYIDTLQALASALDAKDAYTQGHSERVAQYAVDIARELRLPEDKIETIGHMALLHDIGKIGVSDELLTRVGKLSSNEFDLVKLHPVIGANILKEIHELDSVAYVRHHHEKYDGSGYPDGLLGGDIPLGARIITLADSFDAMTTDRTYRSKMNIEQALEEIERSAGSHFDPQLAEVFIKHWQGQEPMLSYNSAFKVASITDK